MKIKMLFDGNFEIDRHPVHLTTGEIVDVTAEDAARLIEGLCAEEIEGETINMTAFSDEVEKFLEVDPKKSRRKKAGDE